MATMPTSQSGTGSLLNYSGVFPRLKFVHNGMIRESELSVGAFTIGRRPGKDLEIADPRVSRDHADILCEDNMWWLIDGNSKLGTFVNGKRIAKHKLNKNDVIEFGVGVGAQLIFDPPSDTGASMEARELLSQIAELPNPEKTSDLEKLAFFLNAARKLNSSGALEEILLSLIDTTLKLTSAERGFIFLKHEDGTMNMAAACTSKGERLHTDETISHSILQDAANSANEFMVTDTQKFSEMAGRESIIAHDLRTVIAIPLRKAHAAHESTLKSSVIGVLYLDARFVSANISKVSHDLLSVVAREAAALVESTHLAKAEDTRRRYQQEMGIAASIQQRLMTVKLPDLRYVSMNARSLPCKDIGGDFFDVVANEDGLTVVMTDVSGKGISAALLASILQGMIYSQVIAKVPLADIAAACNRFLCSRVKGEKYATAVIARVAPDGAMELVNCGHVPPVMVRGGKVERVTQGNLPIGLVEFAEFTSVSYEFRPGDRLVLVTDGVTEAEDAAGEFFGDDRLEQVVKDTVGECFDTIMSSIRKHCGDTPFTDDCTLLELSYRGRHIDDTDPKGLPVMA